MKTSELSPLQLCPSRRCSGQVRLPGGGPVPTLPPLSTFSVLLTGCAYSLICLCLHRGVFRWLSGPCYNCEGVAVCSFYSPFDSLVVHAHTRLGTLLPAICLITGAFVLGLSHVPTVGHHSPWRICCKHLLFSLRVIPSPKTVPLLILY